jgi:hypothetical protein
VKLKAKKSSILFMIGSSISALFIPLPPVQSVVYPEETYFFSNRVAFQEVMDLASQNRLECLDQNCTYSSRPLPQNYSYLSKDGVISVYCEPASRGLVVEFRPLSYSYPVVYFEVPQDRNLPWHSECQGIRWIRQLDEHWFLCVDG